MVYYRRIFYKGGTYFFTVNLRNRKLNLLTQYINLLGGAYNQTKREHTFKTIAYVILPDHLHVIWELPKNDANYSLRWRKIKRYFTISLLQKNISLSKNKHGEYNIWQRRFWEHVIRDENDLELHINYIHSNPGKHGLIKDLSQWPYSSFHSYAAKGKLFTMNLNINENAFGER